MSGTGLLCLIALTGPFQPAIAQAATLWVDRNSPAASDNNSGWSESLPLATVTAATSKVKPGDTVIIKGSTDPQSSAAVYDRSGQNGLPIQTAGQPNAPITFQACAGQTVILQGDGTHWGLPLDYASYNTIQGLTFRNFNKSAEGFSNPSNIVIENCEFTISYETGLRLRTIDHLVMRNCYVHHCFEAGISLRGCTNVILENVESSYNSDGLGADGDADGFHSIVSNGLTLVNCTAIGNGEDGYDLTGDTQVISCVGTTSGACNYKFWRRSEDNYAPHRYDLVNCVSAGAGEAGLKASVGAEVHLINSVVYDNNEEGVAFRDPGSTVTAPIYSVVANCIIAGNGWQPIAVLNTNLNRVTGDHNLYYQNGLASSGLQSDSHAVNGADPRFGGANLLDFQLLAGSPAIDAGSNQAVPPGVTTDLDGNPRIAGSAVDIGAYECQPPGVVTITAWRSVRQHAGLGELSIVLDPVATGDRVASETRRYGIQKIEVDFNARVVGPLVGTVQAEDLTHGTVVPATAQTLTNGNTTLAIEFAGGLPDQACYRIDLAGHVLGLSGDADCRVRGLVGDVDGNGSTDLMSMACTKSRNGQPASPDNARFDVNLDGSIDLIDMALVKSLNGGSATCP